MYKRDVYLSDEDLKTKHEILHKMSKASKVGDKVICPACERVFVKESERQVFCGVVGKYCGYLYWNIVKDWGD